jgi:hypothetical protein
MYINILFVNQINDVCIIPTPFTFRILKKNASSIMFAQPFYRLRGVQWNVHNVWRIVIWHDVYFIKTTGVFVTKS